jgi:hypothetical protein
MMRGTTQRYGEKETLAIGVGVYSMKQEGSMSFNICQEDEFFSRTTTAAGPL